MMDAERGEQIKIERSDVASACLEAGKQLVQWRGRLVDPRAVNGMAALALVPAGVEVVDLRPYLPAGPARKTGKVIMTTVESFVGYVAEHKTAATRVFADVAEAPYLFRAVIDYHCPGPEGAATFCEHLCTLTLQQTAEWIAWTKADGKAFEQPDFAEFLEDNDIYFQEPNGARMLEIALTIKAGEGGQFRSHHRLANGNVALQYEHTTTAHAGEKGELEIPEDLVLALRPFEGCPPAKVRAKFRYRIRSGQITFAYRLLHTGDIVRRIVEESVKEIGEQLAVPVYMGAPGAPVPVQTGGCF